MRRVGNGNQHWRGTFGEMAMPFAGGENLSMTLIFGMFPGGISKAAASTAISEACCPKDGSAIVLPAVGDPCSRFNLALIETTCVYSPDAEKAAFRPPFPE